MNLRLLMTQPDENSGVTERRFHVFKSIVQYMKHVIYDFTSIFHGLIRTHKWPAPIVSGFIAQFVRASHRYRKVTGSKPVKVVTFQASIRYCLIRVHNCDDYSLLYFKSADQYLKHFIYEFTERSARCWNYFAKSPHCKNGVANT